MSVDETGWENAVLIANLLAIDPAGLGGVTLRGGGMMRDHFLKILRSNLSVESPWRRLPHNADDDALLGGLDLASTLRARRPVVQSGLLAATNGGIVMLSTAHRVFPKVAALITGALDTGVVTSRGNGLATIADAQFGLVALDDGIAEDERPPENLLDRLAFHIDFENMSSPIKTVPTNDPAIVVSARATVRQVESGPEIAEALCAAAMSLGISSLRTPILGLRTAKAIAALRGRLMVEQDDIILAAELVLAPRAKRVPAAERTDPETPDPTKATNALDDELVIGQNTPLSDIVLQAARAALPANLLSRLAQHGVEARTQSTGRAGMLQRSWNRGRPIGTVAGDKRMGARLHVLETLKAAAPWQTLRRREKAGDVTSADSRVEVRRSDFRIVRYRHPSETLTIFVVDASGSSAIHRLAEAKGAVELLFSDCYVRRDQVALIAFRGNAAELILPPTNALARARKCLASMPGGGGTPLAAGLQAGAALAEAARRRGRTPLLTVLTDGRANIATDGTADRVRAEADAHAMARLIRQAGTAVLLIDTAPRQDERARRLGVELGARYLPLPQADAMSVSRVIRETKRAVDSPAAA